MSDGRRLVPRSLSPVHVGAKLFERRISRHECHAFQRTLGSQHAVEWISVRERVAACLESMAAFDRHDRESIGCDQLGESLAGTGRISPA